MNKNTSKVLTTITKIYKNPIQNKDGMK